MTNKREIIISIYKYILFFAIFVFLLETRRLISHYDIPDIERNVNIDSVGGNKSHPIVAR